MSATCAYGDCEETKFVARYLCKRHYRLVSARGQAKNYPAMLRRPVPSCSVDGCTNAHSARGFCKTHYLEQALDVPADLDLETLEKVPTGDGYVNVRSNGVLVPMHRVVMTRILGRRLRRGESVHHINGIRSDNRPENLELWVGGIRYGQRAADVCCPHCGGSYLVGQVSR